MQYMAILETILNESQNMTETVTSVGVSCNHFEFQVNQQTKKFYIVIIGFLIQQNMALESKILSLSILDAKL